MKEIKTLKAVKKIIDGTEEITEYACEVCNIVYKYKDAATSCERRHERDNCEHIWGNTRVVSDGDYDLDIYVTCVKCNTHACLHSDITNQVERLAIYMVKNRHYTGVSYV